MEPEPPPSSCRAPLYIIAEFFRFRGQTFSPPFRGQTFSPQTDVQYRAAVVVLLSTARSRTFLAVGADHRSATTRSDDQPGCAGISPDMKMVMTSFSKETSTPLICRKQGTSPGVLMNKRLRFLWSLVLSIAGK